MLFGAEAVCTEAITLGCSEPGGYCCVPPAAVKFNTECSVWPSVMVNAKLYLADAESVTRVCGFSIFCVQNLTQSGILFSLFFRRVLCNSSTRLEIIVLL